ncbi:MAG: hypothetical protein HY706_02220 [Candidatus Hydrogenedentes bacterium]|nr:hypothetical protein [Candidatus Hydrogenedentota bacterium]
MKRRIVLLILVFGVPVLFPRMAYAGAPVAGDVDASGAVDAVDVQVVINAALGVAGAFLTDLDYAGTTDAVDVQLVINVALGLVIDADYDGLADVAEARLLTNPADFDSDDDTMGDGEEILLGRNPLHYDVPLTLAKKAEIFEFDLIARFVYGGQVMCKLKRPTAEIPQVTYNMPDNAYMTGIYLGMLAMKYAVTHDANTRNQAFETIQALDLLCNVSGKNGLLARAAIPVTTPFSDDGEWYFSGDGRYRWRANVSSDQMDGVFYGFALAYDLVADDAHKAIIARNARNLVDHVMEHDMHIEDVDGEATTWGHYESWYVQDYEHMNALLWLQHVKITAHVTGDPYYAQVYDDFANNQGYADLAVTARVMGDPLGGDVNYSDDVLQYLAYYALIRLETDPTLRAKYLASLTRSWNGDEGWPGLSPVANPMYAFNVHAHLGVSEGDVAGIQTLQWFPLDIKWIPATIDTYESLYGFVFDPTIRSPEPLPGQPVPIDRRPNTWSTLVQNPYKAGARDPNHGMEFNGHDYTAAYWLGRFHGYITPVM